MSVGEDDEKWWGRYDLSVIGRLHESNRREQSDLIGPILTSSRSRGNIILELDDTRATQLLFDLINKVPGASTSKDKEFYLAVAPSGTEGIEETAMVVNRITSGDPIKGNMAVDTVRDLVPGQYVQVMVEHEGRGEVDVLDLDYLVTSLYLFCRFAKQFMHRIEYVPGVDSTPLAGMYPIFFMLRIPQILLTTPQSPTTATTLHTPTSLLLSLSVSDPAATLAEPLEIFPPAASVTGVFGGASENGIIIGRRRGEGGFVCDVPFSGASVSLKVE